MAMKSRVQASILTADFERLLADRTLAVVWHFFRAGVQSVSPGGCRTNGSGVDSCETGFSVPELGASRNLNARFPRHGARRPRRYPDLREVRRRPAASSFSVVCRAFNLRDSSLRHRVQVFSVQDSKFNIQHSTFKIQNSGFIVFSLTRGCPGSPVVGLLSNLRNGGAATLPWGVQGEPRFPCRGFGARSPEIPSGLMGSCACHRAKL